PPRRRGYGDSRATKDLLLSAARRGRRTGVRRCRHERAGSIWSNPAPAVLWNAEGGTASRPPPIQPGPSLLRGARFVHRRRQLVHGQIAANNLVAHHEGRGALQAERLGELVVLLQPV